MSIKFKFAILIVTILILFGILMAIHRYETSFYNIKESFNTNAPMVNIKLDSDNPVYYIVIYGNISELQWFHLNSFLFFDTNGKLLQYYTDYYHGSYDYNYPEDKIWNNYGHWGDPDFGILWNTDPNKKNTYWHSAQPTSAFYTVFTPPVKLGKIYMRNRFSWNNSGQPYKHGATAAIDRLKTHSMAFVDKVSEHWMANHKLNDDSLFNGTFDVVYNITTPNSEKIAAEQKAAKIQADKKKIDDENKAKAKTAAEKAEKERQTAIKNILVYARELNNDAEKRTAEIKRIVSNLQDMRYKIIDLDSAIYNYNNIKISYTRDMNSPTYDYTPSTDLNEIQNAFNYIIMNINDFMKNLNIPISTIKLINDTIQRAKTNINRMKNKNEKDKIVKNAWNELYCMNMPNVFSNFQKYNDFTSKYKTFIEIKDKVIQNRNEWNRVLKNKNASQNDLDEVKAIFDNVFGKLYDTVKDNEKNVRRIVETVNSKWVGIIASFKTAISRYADSIVGYNTKILINKKQEDKLKESNDLHKTVTTTQIISPYTGRILTTGNAT